MKQTDLVLKWCILLDMNPGHGRPHGSPKLICIRTCMAIGVCNLRLHILDPYQCGVRVSDPKPIVIQRLATPWASSPVTRGALQGQLSIPKGEWVCWANIQIYTHGLSSGFVEKS